MEGGAYMSDSVKLEEVPGWLILNDTECVILETVEDGRRRVRISGGASPRQRAVAWKEYAELLQDERGLADPPIRVKPLKVPLFILAPESLPLA